MKKVIKIVLFLLLIIISIIFYKVYFGENKKSKNESNISNNLAEEQEMNNPENNLIKNLKYEVKLDKQNQYIITSDLSEIFYDSGVEMVKMKKVIAVLIDQNNIPLIVTSELATYNISNYNTKFSQNVRVEYLNNIILSDKLDFNFNDNSVIIYDNVKYDGNQGNIAADNIKIDLITKKIEIYMYNNNDNVKVTTK